MFNGRTIVCLCGSTRFSKAFREANLQETLAGRIVLTVGCDTKSDMALHVTAEDKKRLDELHLDKIEMADEVLIIDCLYDGHPYIGESTQRELNHAVALHKRVRLWSEEKMENGEWRMDDNIFTERVKL